MNALLRPLAGLALVGGLTTLLTSCDYAANSPGVNTQFRHSWANPPGYTNADINRDSINYKQTVTKPIGKGSATAIKNGTVDDQLNSAPGGKSAASSQDASGKTGPVEQNQTQPKGNGVGKDAAAQGTGTGGQGVSSGTGTGNSRSGNGM